MNRYHYAPLALALACCAPAFAQPTPAMPTHCKAGESAILNAKVGQLDKATNAVKNRKLVSLCADKPAEPFGKFSYRFGPPGKVELEQVATPADPFGIHTRRTSPKTGEDIVFFSKGEFSYYVAEGTGMGRGVSLLVFKSGKKLAELWSGLEETDYESRLTEISFSKAKAASPVLAKRAPKDKF